MTKITRQVIQYYEEEIPNSIKEFKNWQFSSGGTTGEDFKIFARKFRSYVKKNLPANSQLINFSGGHYYVSGFVKKKGSKFIYFSISDVRYFPSSWYNNIMIRTAQHDKDYAGGSNSHTTLENFKINIDRLLLGE